MNPDDQNRFAFLLLWILAGGFIVPWAWVICKQRIEQANQAPNDKNVAYYCLLQKYLSVAVGIAFFPVSAALLALGVVVLILFGLLAGGAYLLTKHRQRFERRWEAEHSLTVAEPTLLRPCEPVEDTDMLLRVVGQD